MANVTAKTSSNIFYKARCEAATHNEQLSSREGAADYGPNGKEKRGHTVLYSLYG